MIGFLVVDKPSGMTSHDVVLKVRRGIQIKQIGHAGTLDPMATGVLVLCLGDATRLSEYVMASTKTYEATLHLGIETDTYDADGRITAQIDATHITQAMFEEALNGFRGVITQVPPMYSAIKQNGVALYKLARAGQEVERPARTQTISALTLLDWSPPYVSIRVMCDAGTYIRSLGHDLGAALGVGAHLSALRRVQSGALADPVDWDRLVAAMQDNSWQQYIIDEKLPLGTMPAFTLDVPQTAAIRHGQSLSIPVSIPVMPVSPESQSTIIDGSGTFLRLYDPNGQLVAIAEKREDRLKPVKVFDHSVQSQT